MEAAEHLLVVINVTFCWSWDLGLGSGLTGGAHQQSQLLAAQYHWNTACSTELPGGISYVHITVPWPLLWSLSTWYRRLQFHDHDRDRRTLSSLSARRPPCLVSSPDGTCLRGLDSERPSRWDMEQGVAAVGPPGRLAAHWQAPEAPHRPHSSVISLCHTHADGVPGRGLSRACLHAVRAVIGREACILRCDTLSIGPESRRRFVCCTVHSRILVNGRFRPVTELPCDRFYDNTATASPFGLTAGPNRRHAPILPASAVPGPVPPAMESAQGWQLPVLPDDDDNKIACHCCRPGDQGSRPSPYAQGKPSVSPHADESALRRCKGANSHARSPRSVTTSPPCPTASVLPRKTCLMPSPASASISMRGLATRTLRCAVRATLWTGWLSSRQGRGPPTR